ADRTYCKRGAIDHGGRISGAGKQDREDGNAQQSCDAPHLQGDGRGERRNHVRVLVPSDGLFSDRVPERVLAEGDASFSRTPRPCEWLAAPSSIISMPAASKTAISLTSESTLPRTMVSLASMR